MSDHVRHLTVILDNDYRDDACERIVDAIRMIKGVAKIETHVVSGADYMARETARMELQIRLREVLWPRL